MKQRLVRPETPDCRASVLDCGSPLPLSNYAGQSQSGRGLPQSCPLMPRGRPACCSPARECRTHDSRVNRTPALAGLILTLLVPWRSLAAADLPPAPSRLPRTNLLVFHDRARRGCPRQIQSRLAAAPRRNPPRHDRGDGSPARPGKALPTGPANRAGNQTAVPMCAGPSPMPRSRAHACRPIC